jgi:hypothetical protein
MMVKLDFLKYVGVLAAIIFLIMSPSIWRDRRGGDGSLKPIIAPIEAKPGMSANNPPSGGRVLILGSDGQIGSALTTSLIARGYRVCSAFNHNIILVVISIIILIITIIILL